MDNQQKALNLLGLATRARKLVSGTGIVLDTIRSKDASLVVLAKDASENTKKQFLNKCDYYHTPLIIDFSQAELSSAIGRERTVCAFTDDGFARTFKNCMSEKKGD